MGLTARFFIAHVPAVVHAIALPELGLAETVFTLELRLPAFPCRVGPRSDSTHRTRKREKQTRERHRKNISEEMRNTI